MFKLVACVLFLGCAVSANQQPNFDNVELPSEFKTDLQELIKDPSPKNVKGINAKINEYVDKILGNVANLMIQSGLDPMKLPDVDEKFDTTILFIHYTGELALTLGWLNDLATIQRNGDAIVNYEPSEKILEIDIPLTFDTLSFTYNYLAKVMGLGPTGAVDGSIKNFQIKTKIVIDLTTFQGRLDVFEVVNSGKIDLHFTGNILIDWLVNLLSDVTTTILRRIILNIMETIIKGGLESVLNAINEIIYNILNPTTTTSAPTTSTLTPSTSTSAPTTSTLAPTSSSLAPTTSTLAPTTSTLAPTSSTLAPTTSTLAPTSSTLAPTSSTLAPTSSTLVPTTSTLAPTTSTLAPTTSTLAPTSSTLAPTTSTLAPTSSTLAPSTESAAPPAFVKNSLILRPLFKYVM